MAVTRPHGYPADPAAVDAVLTASRSLVAVATLSLGGVYWLVRNQDRREQE